jgi:hypothetical protein
MKIPLFLMLLVASVAHCQSRSTDAVIPTMPSHEQHAGYTSPRPEQSLLSGPSTTVGNGEQPLWSVYRLSEPDYSLGRKARLLRKPRTSKIVYVNQ